ncbi:MAG: T9SS type A sorting domain-containing protein [Candidatus Edwardsbacteria bacterium]|nr:T9SS type A sorting domain-containing protein [Candidatus Edwardsbacteria bacterium]
MNDTLVVIAWGDSRNGDWDVYARNYYITTGSMSARGASYKVNGDATVRRQDYPSVSMPCSSATATNNRYTVIAWEDSRTFTTDANTEIWCRQYDATGATYGFERVVSQVRPARLPSVCKGRNRFAFAVAWEDSGIGGWQVKLRYNDSRNIFDREKTANNSTEPPGKHGASACLGRSYANVAFLDSSRTKCRGDILEQGYSLAYGTTQDSLVPYYFNFKMNQDDKVRANGRTGWYHYPDYDNPLTAWNENPRPAAAADSVLMPLDSTYVRAILSRNITPGQYYFRVKDTDTILAGRTQGKGTINAAEYDVCLMDLGYATTDLSAGSVSRDQQDSLVKFNNDGGALIVSGNDFGEMYDGTALFNLFGADYLGAGNTSATGNIDSLGGMSDAFSRGMAFHYPYQQEEDNSVDLIAPLSSACDTLFGGDPAKWARCRGCYYTSYYKGTKAVWHKNVYLPFVMTALTSDGQHPNTATELTRRILGFQGFNVEPAPIHDLAADTTTSTAEGAVTIRWKAVSDDSLAERASRYQLKISEYNAALPEAGKFTSEQQYVDSGITYYQAWTPAGVGATETQTLALVPGRSYIFAIKAGDESSPTRWSALGSEPMIKSRGDTLTPHTIAGIGAGYGLISHFTASERIDVRGGDTLNFTWDAASMWFGIGRVNWYRSGDLFIYLDTRTGGADSTIKWNGAGDTAALFDSGKDFRPDFCFVLDSTGTGKCKLMKWSGSAWVDSINPYTSSYYHIDTVNTDNYTEIRVPFGYVKYTAGDPFKFQVLCQNETSEHTFNAFPVTNGIGKSKALTRYGYYYRYDRLGTGLSPRNAAQPLAVGLAEFGASAGEGTVSLQWTTSSENDNYQWLIERSREPDRDYVRIGTVPAQGGPSGHSYRYVDAAVQSGTYYYLLGDQDLDGVVTWHGPVSAMITTIPAAGLWLGQCDPNPVRGPAVIDYAVPRAGHVTLRLYDICGREVRTVVDEGQAAGRHRAPWNGDDARGRPLAAGVYFYRLSHDGRQATGKLVVVH